MSGVNKVILVGNLGKDPEVRYMESGDAVCNFSIATSEKWKDKNSGEDKEKTEWHRIVVWGKLAELCGEYLRKGRKVYVEGKLQTRQWEQEGVTRYTTEVLVPQFGGKIVFLSPKDENGQSASPAPRVDNRQEEDIPF